LGNVGDMHAITITEPGGPEVLQLTELPDPVPGPGQVLVEVAAAGVNRADLMQRQGNYNPPPGVPADIPGLEVSGTIAALGPDVTGWPLGSEVCALLAGGGYASKVLVPVGQLLPVPKGVSLIDAAGLPETVCTVWSNVFMLAKLQPGEWLLAHGGASGIGTTAIQLAKRHGARVAVTVGSAEKAARCLELGADLAVNYREGDFVAALRGAAGGADVILDIIGAKYLAQNLDALNLNGRMMLIALQGGPIAEINLGLLLYKRASLSGNTLRARPLAEKAAIVSSVQAGAWPAYEEGAARPIIHRTLPLAEAGEAHRILDASEHIGKVLLTP
jgi:putative PIG3 family NAD(P)H quinone oxidoreductase